jgi:3-oxoacyl-(acyl-carrier-protein) synthase
MGGNARYAYIAMDRALQDSGLKPEEYNNNPRVASIIGQVKSSFKQLRDLSQNFSRKCPDIFLELQQFSMQNRLRFDRDYPSQCMDLIFFDYLATAFT